MPSLYYNNLGKDNELQIAPAQIKKMFEINNKLSKQVHYTFVKTLKKILKNAGISQTWAATEIGVQPSTISDWVGGAAPAKENIVKLAIRCKIDLLTTVTLLRSGGYAFNLAESKEYAWAYLIMYCGGKSLDECNKILSQFGFTENDGVFLYQNGKNIKPAKKRE